MIQTLILGDCQRAEMLPIVTWLRARVPTEACTVSRRLDDVRDQFDQVQRADWVIVLESHPDEFSLDEVHELFALFPGSRILCCAGAWSESAGRNRKIWPLALRVPAVNAIAQLEQEWQHVSNLAVNRPLPPTGSREEWFAALHPPLSNMTLSKITLNDQPGIAIVTPDAAYREMLVCLIASCGGSPTGNIETDTKVILWDADPDTDATHDMLATLLQNSPQLPVIALTGWMTPEQSAELLARGVHAVIPKFGDQQRVLDAIAHAVPRG